MNLVSVVTTKRLDAGFFSHPANKALNKLIVENHFVPLSSVLEYISSGHTPYKHDTSIGDIKFITVECIDNLILRKDKLKFIKKEQYNNEFKKNRIIQNSVVCTIKRRICKAFPFFTVDEPMAMNQDVAFLIPNNKIKAGYLATYLNCKVGQLFADKQKTEQMNPYISVENLSTLQIFLPSIPFQDVIDSILLSAYQKLSLSQSLYTEAEALLLSELGLKDWKPTEETESVKSFLESFGQSGRLDAEYYQPKYDELLNHISKYPTKKLNTIVNIKKSIEPGSDAYLDNGIPFIRVANLSKYGLTEPEIHLDRKFYELMDLKPKKDTILLSKDGSVGIAYKLEKDLDAITSGAILHLTIKDEDFLPDYLTLVLNSIIVWFQAERDAGGSIIQHWKPSEIEEVIIPKIDKTIQQNITDKVQKSFALKAQSRQLLDLAKRGVEMAIERGEDEAREWMKENMH